MSDRENNRPTTSGEWKEHIIEYVSGCEFGSVEFLAANDFKNLLYLCGEIGSESDTLIDSVSGKANLTKEDRIDITRRKVALLEHTIEQNKARIPGYTSAYFNLDSNFDEMLRAARKEAVNAFPNQEIEQFGYVRDIYQVTLGHVNDTLIEKQIPSLKDQQ
jgi:hypothetical protein